MKVKPIPSRARKIWIAPAIQDPRCIDHLTARHKIDLGQYAIFARQITLIPVRKCK